MDAMVQCVEGARAGQLVAVTSAALDGELGIIPCQESGLLQSPLSAARHVWVTSMTRSRRYTRRHCVPCDGGYLRRTRR